MEIVVGTYEELILSYKLEENNEKSVISQSFTDHSHTGNVKTVAISKKGVLASGSSDETLRLFNLFSRKEIGRLMHHSGSITNVEFFGKKHMFSSSEDGTIGVWQVGRWECLRTLKGHKGPVNWLSVHPSGKLALSVGRDKTLRTWNLITAKCAFVSNIKAEADIVIWSPSGEFYLIAVNNKIDVYDTETTSVIHTITVTSRVNVMKFIKRVVVLAGEGGNVYCYDITTAEKLYEFSTETNRIKGLEVIAEDDKIHLVTGSSDGFIKVWKLNTSKWQHKLAASHDTKFRITCLAAVSQSSVAKERGVAQAAEAEQAAEDAEEEDVKDEDASASDADTAEDAKDEDTEVKKPTKSPRQQKKQKRKSTSQSATESPKKKGKFQKLKKKKNLQVK